MLKRNAVNFLTIPVSELRIVGKFHTTKIWEFKMNCHLCSNTIIVQTDPEHTDYKFIEGATKIVKNIDCHFKTQSFQAEH